MEAVYAFVQQLLVCLYRWWGFGMTGLWHDSALPPQNNKKNPAANVNPWHWSVWFSESPSPKLQWARDGSDRGWCCFRLSLGHKNPARKHRYSLLTIQNGPCVSSICWRRRVHQAPKATGASRRWKGWGSCGLAVCAKCDKDEHTIFWLGKTFNLKKLSIRLFFYGPLITISKINYVII